MKTPPIALVLLTLAAPLARSDDAPSGDGLPAADDVADVPAIDVRLGDDPKKRYALIGLDEERKAPKKGYKLLVILPGGTGAVDFHPFCKRIHKHVLDDGWLTAQIVAPVWSEKQAETHVWPTREHEWKGMEFATEDFVFEAIEDVARRAKLDPAAILTLTWSSSGPAGYAMALAKDSPINGSFVAMSVFKPDLLPNLDRAKRHPFYILHSPEDFIPIAMAEKAEKDLTKHRGRVELVEYEGGHGWQGDVYGMMRAGVSYLERERSNKARRKITSRKRGN